MFDDLSNSPESRDSAKPIHKWSGNIAKITSFEWNSTTWLLILYSLGLEISTVVSMYGLRQVFRPSK